MKTLILILAPLMSLNAMAQTQSPQVESLTLTKVVTSLQHEVDKKGNVLNPDTTCTISTNSNGFLSVTTNPTGVFAKGNVPHDRKYSEKMIQNSGVESFQILNNFYATIQLLQESKNLVLTKSDPAGRFGARNVTTSNYYIGSTVQFASLTPSLPAKPMPAVSALVKFMDALCK